jgi:hypothetical protein
LPQELHLHQDDIRDRANRRALERVMHFGALSALVPKLMRPCKNSEALQALRPRRSKIRCGALETRKSISDRDLDRSKSSGKLSRAP